jgi:hypothetical protein
VISDTSAFSRDILVEAPSKATKTVPELQKTAMGAFAAFTIASSAFSSLPAVAQPPSFASSSSMMIAEKVTREGVYGEYTIDVQPQKYDDARSTFKAASETKSKKGKFAEWIRMLIVTSSLRLMISFLQENTPRFWQF